MRSRFVVGETTVTAIQLHMWSKGGLPRVRKQYRTFGARGKKSMRLAGASDTQGTHHIEIIAAVKVGRGGDEGVAIKSIRVGAG